ncbi:MAG: histidine kinase, partial [Spirochaetes bacterium]
LLLNELITNCIKHAFPDNREGVITIELHKLEGEKTMIILEDNGVGLPPGLNIQEADSLGLKLVETLVKQIEGKLELRSGESGTRWKIIF